MQPSHEVASALASGSPVVALESTILTHGLPFPKNLEMGRAVEKMIRAEGCVPATTAFLAGQARVGLNEKELERLASSRGTHKISRRDIPSAFAHAFNGGTTVAATMILAKKAGIKVFATGGLGGVHRGVAETWDISADLEELSKTPIAVVCSGPKSILDVPKTLEYLETKGVPVSTYGQKSVPGFFTRDSGVSSPYVFDSPEDAASVIKAGLDFGMQNGYVFCVPCPSHLSMPAPLVDRAIESALEQAALEGITGKATTPYLLEKIWQATGGNSVSTNIEFVKNNARVAAQIARSLAALEGSISIQIPTRLEPRAKPPVRTLQRSSEAPKVLAVGALAQDMTCTLEAENISVSSYPGKISTTLGGAAHNVALSSAYGGVHTRLVSVIGEKESGEISRSLSPAIDASGVLVTESRTARYISMNDSKGELIVACADMETISSQLDLKHLSTQLSLGGDGIIVFDGNLGKKQTQAILDFKSSGLKLFEPTSVVKAARLAHQSLKVWPSPSVDIAFPNSLELMSMFEEFSFLEKFDVQNWFPIVDALPMDAVAEMKLDLFVNRCPGLENIIQSGLVQAAIHLLPYIPNLFVTMGSKGVISFQLIEGLKDRTGGDRDGVPSVYIIAKNRQFGLLIQHFKSEDISNDQVKSVNGAGDTFCGMICAQLAQTSNWLRDDGTSKRNAITRAQRAATLSLQTYDAVSSGINDI